MVRLFSIDIDFRNEIYPALVSIREDDHDLCCQVRYIDKRVHNILPGDVLVFNLAEGIKEPKYLSTTLAKEFLRSTTDAICKHWNADVL
jgi:hypothetical protein